MLGVMYCTICTMVSEWNVLGHVDGSLPVLILTVTFFSILNNNNFKKQCCQLIRNTQGFGFSSLETQKSCNFYTEQPMNMPANLYQGLSSRTALTYFCSKRVLNFSNNDSTSEECNLKKVYGNMCNCVYIKVYIQNYKSHLGICLTKLFWTCYSQIGFPCFMPCLRPRASYLFCITRVMLNL